MCQITSKSVEVLWNRTQDDRDENCSLDKRTATRPSVPQRGMKTISVVINVYPFKTTEPGSGPCGLSAPLPALFPYLEVELRGFPGSDVINNPYEIVNPRANTKPTLYVGHFSAYRYGLHRCTNVPAEHFIVSDVAVEDEVPNILRNAGKERVWATAHLSAVAAVTAANANTGAEMVKRIDPHKEPGVYADSRLLYIRSGSDAIRSRGEVVLWFIGQIELERTTMVLQRYGYIKEGPSGRMEAAEVAVGPAAELQEQLVAAGIVLGAYSQKIPS
ncbi:hypothetical protein B0H12DRAFT_1221522 [Mycena haematopus]|nr:hypothetical protein B0H12DRAFT_1221522 [Mycena haematopus]